MVELNAWLPHAEVEDLCIHVVFDFPIIQQLPYVVLYVRTYQTKRVLRQRGTLLHHENVKQSKDLGPFGLRF